MLLGFLSLLLFATIIILVGYITILSWEISHPSRITAGWALAHHWPACPADVGLPFEEWSLDRPGGVVLPVWDIPPDDAAPTRSKDDPPISVVVLHGWGRSRIDSLARVTSLLKDPPGGCRTFRTILPELRGHGDAPPGATTLGAMDVDDVHELLQQLGDGPVILIGHSLGAVIALHVAAMDADRGRIGAVIALAPYDRLTTPFTGYLRSREYPAGPLAGCMMLLLRLFGRDLPDTQDVAGRIKARVDVVAGADDRVIPPSIGRMISDRIGTSRFHDMPGTSHSNHHRKDPELISRLLDEALRHSASAKS
ncbi:MAG: alpha/beta hydrolase [Phycisphaerales bacterium]|nr:alpha/beta hydrolase [Phycisphaerales bacterium]